VSPATPEDTTHVVTSDILKSILARKREELVARCERLPLTQLSARIEGMEPPRGFARALHARIDAGEAAVIAEIKKASPSKGVLREHFDPPVIAASYARGGAAALSVLTDIDFFQGADEYLAAARNACALPALRKDFIIDAYQVYEARAIGADCILLIVAALGDALLNELAGLALHLDLDVLVEVHDAVELDRVSHMRGTVLGINNRDLRTFETSLDTTLDLLDEVPDGRLVVTESGIHTPADVARMRAAGVHAFLVSA
jgi:indole-3-glycerol phosphate synthase